MISVIILTKNSETYLKDVLASCTSFSEVLVYDGGSTDQTVKIAECFNNVKICKAAFIGTEGRLHYGPYRNAAAKEASHDWVLMLDSDECLSPELADEIQRLTLNPTCIYAFPRKNYFNGKWIKGCGWFPDHVIRLYNRMNTSYTNDYVHERVISNNMKLIYLKHPLIHYSYSSVADFLSKMQLYSELFAEQQCGKKRASCFKALLHALFTFMKSYFLQKGIFLGFEGLFISIYQANVVFYKYLKLAERNENL